MAYSPVIPVVAAPEQRASTTAFELIQGSLSSGRIAPVSYTHLTLPTIYSV